MQKPPLLAYKSPRRCAKCLTPIFPVRFRIPDGCDPVCLLELLVMGEEGKHGHLHWECERCGWREATLPADASGFDRWRQ